MRVSVVIATSNRAASLRVTLDALRHQTHPDFEVVVVQAPCEDDTGELLSQRASEVRTVRNPELNLCKSRNLGIDAAAGEVVAFIDDDSIPEPGWLARLAEGYDDPAVGGVGGMVYDARGETVQYRFSVCDRVGETQFDREPPFDSLLRPGADPYLYLQGTNMSFRREALEAIGGFDENIEYMWDEADLALHLIDAGWTLKPIEGAGVVHRLLPSHNRGAGGTEPYTPVKNRTYFALRNGPAHRSLDEVFATVGRYVAGMRTWAESGGTDGTWLEAARRRFVQRLEAGFEAGVALGTTADRGGRQLEPREETAFLLYPTVTADDQLRLCFVSVDYPPAPMGGIARYTTDLARGFAARGHEVHVVTRSDQPRRLDFEEGVWVHRLPAPDRFLPALEGHPLAGNLAHCTQVWNAVDQVRDRFGLDIVAGNAWAGEPLLCALDPRLPTVVTCATPMRTIAASQPVLAAKEHTEWQIRLEDKAILHADRLHSISQANLDLIRAETPGAAEMDATVAWLGMSDRAPEAPEPSGDGVEILFVGRLEPRKGVETLMAAAGVLLDERPDLRVRLAGAANPHANSDGHRYDDAPHERILFEGAVGDARLDGLLAGCDVFCAPSLYESFGLMNLEAMMFSRPVVSSRAGGIPEVVTDGESGLLIPPGDVGGLTEALRRLVDDPDLRARMGAAGRERYENEFSLAAGLDRLEALLRDVIGEDQAATGAVPRDRVARGFEDVLVSLVVPDAAAVAGQLMDPSAFPNDHRAILTHLQDEPDAVFVRGIYRGVLNREPDPPGLEGHLSSLRAGAARAEILERVVRSDEARMRGVDASSLGSSAAELAHPAAQPEGAGRLRRLAASPAMGAARRVGNRVLRDPRVRNLEGTAERLHGEIGRLHAELLTLHERVEEARQAAERDVLARLDAAAEADQRQAASIDALVERLENAENAITAALARPEGTFGTYMGEGRVLVKTIWGGRLLAPADDLSITPELVAYGVYERAFTNYVLRTLEPGATAIDVGANIGVHSLLMASCVGEGGRVISFEPYGEVLTYLRENLALNWINDRVEVRETAASDAAGRIPFHGTQRFLGGSSLVEPGDTYFAQATMDTTRVVDVETEPLDALEDLGQVALVKIDVEGAEHLVLQGMSKLMDSRAVAAVSFEVYRDRAGDWASLSAQLESREDEGWSFRTIEEDGSLEPVLLATVLEVGRFAQIVMLPPV